NGVAAAMRTGIVLIRGDRFMLGARRSRGRAYIAVAGGIRADRWLGSLPTSLLAGRGGMHGRNLKAGDVIEVAREATRPAVSGHELASHLRIDYADHSLFAIPGRHVQRLHPETRRLLFAATTKASRGADGMGYE